MSNGGPATPAGKTVSKLNATRHGIRSPEPVVPGVERAEDWQEHREGILQSISPVGHLESTLTERVALLSWRLHRVTRYETESITLSQEKAEDDLADKRHFGSRVLGAAHPRDVRGNLKAAQSEYRLLKRLPGLEDNKPISYFDADSILWTVVEQTDRVADGEIAPEELVKDLRIPGAPSKLSEWREYEGWTAGVVRAGIEAIAIATGEDSEDLLKLVTDAASRKVIREKQAADQIEEGLKNISRERLLPDDKTLEKVSRYEAHLSRLFFKTLHELEALQKQRSGVEVPLARLDVEGLSES